MSARIAVALGVLVTVGLAAGPANPDPSRESAACRAALVHTEKNPVLGTLSGGRWVAGAPRRSGLVGVLSGGEVVDGRFAVYAGGLNPGTRTNEKVLWIVPLRKRVGPRLAISGRKDGASEVTYRRRLAETSSEQTPQHLFPSILDLPVPGCWKLTLRTARISATVTVLAQAAHWEGLARGSGRPRPEARARARLATYCVAVGKASDWLREERRNVLGHWAAVCLGCGAARRWFEDYEDEIPATCAQCGGELLRRCPRCNAPFSSAFAVDCEGCGEPLRGRELFGTQIRRT